MSRTEAGASFKSSKLFRLQIKAHDVDRWLLLIYRHFSGAKTKNLCDMLDFLLVACHECKRLTAEG